MSQVPMLIYGTSDSNGEPSYYVGVALDQLAAWAIEHGCPANQFIERAEEAVERATETVEL